MNRILRRGLIVSLVTGWALASGLISQASAADKLRLLIIDGQNNHAWQVMTPPMKADLENRGDSPSTCATTPPKNAESRHGDLQSRLFEV